MDKYQRRYINHQERKKDILENGEAVIKKCYSDSAISDVLEIIKNRKSVRTFKSKISDETIEEIIKHANLAPSSCNRHGIDIVKAHKKLVPLLVGGKGWVKKCTVLAFYADPKCYKSEYEKDFMPYLDTGFMAQNIYLFCETVGLGCCFVNPNTHNKYKSTKLLTGAIAIGEI